MIPLITSIALGLAMPALATAQVPRATGAPSPSDAASVRVIHNGETVIIETTSDDGANLLELVSACEAITGYRFVLGSRGLETYFVRLSSHHEVPKARFFGFFQDCLRVLDLALISLPSTASNSTARSYEITQTTGGNGDRPGSVKTSAGTLQPAELAAHAFDSAIVYTVILPLKHVNSQEAANTLNSYLTDPMTESVRAVAGSNSIVISSFGSNLVSLANMIEQLDAPSTTTSPSIEIFALKHVPAGEIVRQIESHFAPQNPARMNNLPYASVPSVTADERTNSIVASGTSSEIASIKGMVIALDVAVSDATVTQVFVVPGGDGQELAMTLRELFGSHEKSGDAKQGDGVANSAVQFVSTSSGEKLIVRGPAARMNEVADLIAKLGAAK